MRLSLLLMALAITGCESGRFATARIDPRLAALVPPDTIMLAGVRMSDVRATTLYAKLSQQQKLSELDDFAKRTNFDPRKDVNDILIASDGAHTIVLARGALKGQTPPGMKPSEYKGATIYSAGDGAFAILDDVIAVAGPEPAVRAAIDQKQSGGQGPAKLLEQARALPASGQIWFVANGWGTLPDNLSRQRGNLSNMARVFQTLESATGSIDLRSGVSADIRGACRTDQDAKTLGDAIRGMVGLGRLSVPENQPEMLRLFDGIKVEQQQRSVKLTAQIPPDLIDRLLQTTNPPGRGSRK